MITENTKEPHDYEDEPTDNEIVERHISDDIEVDDDFTGPIDKPEDS